MKKIAILGATGGIGQQIVFALAGEHEIILIDKNLERLQLLLKLAHQKHPNAKLTYIQCDLTSVNSVKNAVNELKTLNIDVFILNSGIFHEKLFKCEVGFNNVFTTNFVMQYYMARKMLKYNPKIKVIAMGSIGHNHFRHRSRVR